MLSLSDLTPIYLFTPPADMRKSFDGLCGLVETHLHAEEGGRTGVEAVAGGRLFVFLNRRRDRMKVMYFDGDGLAIWYKRLERGRFQLPGVADGADHIIIDARQLRLILDGIDLASVRRRQRYQPPEYRPAPEHQPARQDVTDDPRPTQPAGAAAHRRPGGMQAAAG